MGSSARKVQLMWYSIKQEGGTEQETVPEVVAEGTVRGAFRVSETWGLLLDRGQNPAG